MRNRFEEQLFTLNREMLEMGALCEEAVASAATALTAGDRELALRVKENGSAIDQMERDIESLCMKLLLHQQPVARDLRTISAALKMITDLERIGDQAEDIAEIVIARVGRGTMEMERVGEMARETAAMVTSGVDAFAKKDVETARRVIARDDVVDEYFSGIRSRIITAIADRPADGELALDLFMIAKYLERIADHAVNLAGWVIYSVTGSHGEVKS